MPEKTSSSNSTLTLSPHKLELDHLHGASMTGVYAVPTFTDKSVTIKLKNETLFISGQNLEIKVLDVENGKLTLAGQVNLVKYSSSSTPSSFFKRLLK